ncbi:DUF3558 family protein [Nocardia sp. NPDC058379]|uniref:DUF3558 family protein n=1 Tax=unclassified Nocardia TaxID=2637762 RepID=UPI00365D8325
MRYRKLVAAISTSGFLILTVGCAEEPSDTTDTTSAQYLFDNVFNPCRDVPERLLAEYAVGPETKSGDNLVENYAAIGCTYLGTERDFTVTVSNALLSELGRESPGSFAPTQIAGRAARIMSLPQERRFCRLDVEITGGILALTLSGDPSGDNCTVLSAMAEKLVRHLPAGA